MYVESDYERGKREERDRIIALICDRGPQLFEVWDHELQYELTTEKIVAAIEEDA